MGGGGRILPSSRERGRIFLKEEKRREKERKSVRLFTGDESSRTSVIVGGAGGQTLPLSPQGVTCILFIRTGGIKNREK